MILYNIVFLIIGQTLFSGIHHIVEHSHHHIPHETHECEECIEYRNNKNITFENNVIVYFESKFPFLVAEYTNNIELKDIEIYLSRAPPFS